MMKKIKNIFNSISLYLSDVIASSIATWRFVVSYTIIMLLWIILHIQGYLNIDSKDFIKYNLFLSWAAGIQASIILMATNRQATIDRKKLLEGVELDKETLKKIYILNKSDYTQLKNIEQIKDKIGELFLKINKFEEIIADMEEEEEINFNGKTKRN